MQFNFVDLRLKDHFATIGANRVRYLRLLCLLRCLFSKRSFPDFQATIYRSLEDGTIDTLQVYVDSDVSDPLLAP